MSTLNSDSHTFTENGSFDFIATDRAGNSTTKTVTITNIDKTNPTVDLLVYQTASYCNIQIHTRLKSRSTNKWGNG